MSLDPASLVFFFFWIRGENVASTPSGGFAKNEAKWKQRKKIIKGAVWLFNLVLRPTLLRLAMKEYKSEAKVERT